MANIFVCKKVLGNSKNLKECPNLLSTMHGYYSASIYRVYNLVFVIILILIFF